MAQIFHRTCFCGIYIIYYELGEDSEPATTLRARPPPTTGQYHDNYKIVAHQKSIVRRTEPRCRPDRCRGWEEGAGVRVRRSSDRQSNVGARRFTTCAAFMSSIDETSYLNIVNENHFELT